MEFRIKQYGLTEITVHQEGARVQVIRDGRIVMDLDWQMAVKLAKALHVKGLLAEEIANHEAIAHDQALLLRSGAPFGVTSNPAIQKEAAIEAVHDRDLRRFLPGGVKSTEMVGVPTLISHPPKEN